MRTEEVAVTNSIARNVLACLKSGAVLKGTVCSQPTDGSMDVVLISIDLPGIGERQVAVKSGQNLQFGQEVVMQCVPRPHKTGTLYVPDHARGNFEFAKTNGLLLWHHLGPFILAKPRVRCAKLTRSSLGPRIHRGPMFVGATPSRSGRRFWLRRVAPARSTFFLPW